MPPKRLDPTDPAAWLRRAASNLARARAGPSSAEVLYDDLCFDAQQAAEKAIKAVLVAQRTPFPKVHAIERLLGLAEDAGVVVPAEIREAARLTRFATQARYPDVAEEATEDEYRRSVELAGSVVRWARQQIEQPGR